MSNQDYVYKRTPWDRYMYGRQSEQSSSLLDAEGAGIGRSDLFPGFVGEVFGRMFSRDDLERLPEVQPEHRWMELAHSEAENLPEYQSMRRASAGDVYWSTVATVSLAQAVASVLPECSESEEKAGLDRKAAQALREMIEEGRKGGLGEEKLEEAGKYLSELEGSLERALGAFSSQYDGINRSLLREAIRRASGEACDEIERGNEAVSAYGYGDQRGTGTVGMDPAVRNAIAERVKSSKKLTELLDIAGRMKAMSAKAQESKVDYARSEVTSVETGGDIDRVLPSEFANLCDPVAEYDFLSRLSDYGVSQYRLEGKERKGKGPIIVCIDNSGSMSGAKELWSKGVALGMLQAAIGQKRSFYALHFTSEVVGELRFLRGEYGDKGKPAQVMDFLEQFQAGGTKIEPVMRRAVQLVREEQEMREADVVVLSDGIVGRDASLESFVGEAMRETGIRLYAVMFGGASPAVMERLGARVYTMPEIADGVAFSLFGEV